MEYAERLFVPLRWWVQATMLVASFWLALAVAVPPVAAFGIIAVIAALVTAGFLKYGALAVRVADGELRAGRAHLPLQHVGAVTPLDKEQTRLLAGRDANARAYLAMRPYVKRSVRIDVDDPQDPTPYWLVSTRRPKQLAAALTERLAR
ncbi:DUF3093 domain-containing protein [Nocardioides jiangxiensis]|uniref:DUF3093 domain-containing protein n=1 Tax=Nocardioides jiangxiensis TaxID=3064524 RepID=A0ABT9B5F7_9ACTN|nr:DUF3093 domain-containing protein [Nocardioides sp. WY-20]MDO7869473.1 DUF3093 domain-containing protein [Nocardioides sp. WY-20]